MDLRLPNFIYNAIKCSNTSLGDNKALPHTDDIDYAYSLIKSRYDDVIETLKSLGLSFSNIEEAENDLSKYVIAAMKIEKPLRAQLQKVCLNVVNKMFAVPRETVQITCKLVDHITPKQPYRIMPENDEENAYTFNDVDEIKNANATILKRRFIDSLIQGSSYELMKNYPIEEEYDNITPELTTLYAKIIAINDFILFSKPEKISDKNPSQASYVAVHLGIADEKTVIEAQGLILPFLLQETIRGFMELFSSHGLPEDKEKAMYIIRKADFLVAEPWDLRIGVPLWKKAFEKYDIDSQYIPYIFSDICILHVEEFNDMMQNLLMHTKKAEMYMAIKIREIEHNREYQLFIKDIEQKNVETSLLTDGDFSAEEIGSYDLENGKLND
jgi:hypothetical protein